SVLAAWRPARPAPPAPIHAARPGRTRAARAAAPAASRQPPRQLQLSVSSRSSLEIELVRRHAAFGNLTDDAQDAVRELDVFGGAARVTVHLGGARARVHFLPHVRGEILPCG